MVARREAEGRAGEPPVKTCQACGAAMALAERVCPACGYCPPVGTIDEDLTGALRQIDEQMIMEAMMAERPYRELLGLARSREHLRLIAPARGYKRGWPVHPRDQANQRGRDQHRHVGRQPGWLYLAG